MTKSPSKQERNTKIDFIIKVDVKSDLAGCAKKRNGQLRASIKRKQA